MCLRSDRLRLGCGSLTARLGTQKSGGPPPLFGPFVLYDTMEE